MFMTDSILAESSYSQEIDVAIDRTVVIWALAVEPVTEASCRLVNSVTSKATPEFLELISQQGQTFEQAAAPRQRASTDHSRRETPGYAASIARAAKARQRNQARAQRAGKAHLSGTTQNKHAADPGIN
jgi:hypothetical protein